MINLRRKFVLHISMHFWPPRGGQEHLIISMCNIAYKNGLWTLVIQPFKPSLLLLSTYKNYKVPKKTIIIPIPTLWFFCVLLKKTLEIFGVKISNNTKAKIDDLSWLSFNWSLLLLKPILKLIFLDNLKIIHYHFHQMAINIKNSIIYSHGVEWRRPPKSNLDILKIKALYNAVSSSNTKYIIANDTDYIDEIKFFSKNNVIIKKLILLKNPVNINKFHPINDSSIKQYNNKRIIMIRNVRPDRGIYEGIGAFILFSQDNNFRDWTLDIYGKYIEGDEYYLKCIELINGASYKNIFFKGPVNNDDVPLILASAAVSLVPSQELEGTSLSALESMSSGVPCVSTAIGGLRDLPTLKSTSTSSGDIATALKIICDNYDSFRNSQAEFTRNNFDLDSWAHQITKLMLEK